MIRRHTCRVTIRNQFALSSCPAHHSAPDDRVASRLWIGAPARFSEAFQQHRAIAGAAERIGRVDVPHREAALPLAEAIERLPRLVAPVPAELAALGATLAEAAGEHPSAVAAVHLLIFTGCRRNEVLTLRWSTWI